jgi:hypothetical protein
MVLCNYGDDGGLCTHLLDKGIVPSENLVLDLKFETDPPGQWSMSFQPLLLACKKGSISIVQALYHRMNRDSTMVSPDTLLLAALESCSVDILTFLLANGERPIEVYLFNTFFLLISSLVWLFDCLFMLW